MDGGISERPCKLLRGVAVYSRTTAASTQLSRCLSAWSLVSPRLVGRELLSCEFVCGETASVVGECRFFFLRGRLETVR